MSGCEEEGNREPLEHDPTPPGQVTNIQAKAGPGIVTLRYTLPKDENLLYVKAVYTLQSGAEREVRASYYTNTMTLDGFFDTEEHEVKIYSYNKSEVASEPVIIKVRPEESPIWEVRRTLELNADFMGVRVTAENESNHLLFHLDLNTKYLTNSLSKLLTAWRTETCRCRTIVDSFCICLTACIATPSTIGTGHCLFKRLKLWILFHGKFLIRNSKAESKYEAEYSDY